MALPRGFANWLRVSLLLVVALAVGDWVFGVRGRCPPCEALNSAGLAWAVNSPASIGSPSTADAAAASERPLAQNESAKGKDLAPRRVTLQGSMRLGQSLEELARQSGNRVEDRRQSRAGDPALELDLRGVTFWQAVDAIARRADLGVSLYEGDGKLALRDGPYRGQRPVSYDGIFRIVAERVTEARDLDGGGASCAVLLVVAWEPRFRPLFIEGRVDGLEASEVPGRTLKPAEAGSGLDPVAGRLAIERTVRLEAPPRSTERLRLRGRFTLVGPVRHLPFVFEDLRPVTDGEPRVEKRAEGVSARLTDLSATGSRWSVTIALRYPAGGPELESFEGGWLANNRAFLEKKDRSARLRATGYNYEAGDPPARRATLTYYFEPPAGAVLADWKLVYGTPGPLLRVPAEFQFGEIRLP